MRWAVRKYRRLGRHPKVAWKLAASVLTQCLGSRMNRPSYSRCQKSKGET